MSILDFREIAPPTKPTKKDYGGQLDDFEKFAQEFFREVYDAEFIEVAARGADGGRDLLFNVLINGAKQKWAVSCKHTAHSGNAVGEMETNISDRFARSGADVFVGFYSHIPSSGLQQTFLDLERHNPKFKSKIYNSAQIETELLSAQNSKGWFLAARFFPRSFVMLFRRFLQPIAHYQAKNVVDNGKGSLELAYPGGALTSYRDEKDKQSRITSLVKDANDTVTFALHEKFFAELLKEIIKQWPTCFAYWGATPTDQLSTSDILPTFEVQDVIALFQKHSPGIALVVCHFWTWWDEERAVTTYQQAYNQALNSNISEEQARINLGIRIVLQCCPIELRDQITRLVAFAPSDLKELNLWRKIARAVQFNGKEAELKTLLVDSYQKADKSGDDIPMRVLHPKTVLDQLNGCVSIMGHDAVCEWLEDFISQLQDFEYRPFSSLIAANKQWCIKPSTHYDWFAERVPSLNPPKP